MNYGKHLFFTVLAVFGCISLQGSSDYTRENTALLDANADYLTDTQERGLRKTSTLKLTYPDRFKERIAAYRRENGQAFTNQASREGRDPLHVQQAYYQRGHNAGVDALDGRTHEESKSCCCCVQ